MSIITRVWYGVSVRKKRKYVDHFSKIDQSNTYAHIDVISRESVEKKDSMVSASLMKKKEKNIAREKNAAQSISRPFKWVNNSSLIFFGKISHTYSQLDVEKTIEMDD